jgi:hypothetical protein
VIEEEALESGHCDLLAGGVEGFAHEQEGGGLVCDRKGVAVSAVTEFELALEVGAPQIVGGEGL